MSPGAFQCFLFCCLNGRIIVAYFISVCLFLLQKSFASISRHLAYISTHHSEFQRACLRVTALIDVETERVQPCIAAVHSAHQHALAEAGRQCAWTEIEAPQLKAAELVDEQARPTRIRGRARGVLR